MKVVNAVFNRLVSFFALIFSGRTGRVVADLGSLAAAVVLDLTGKDMPGETKRMVAFQRIKQAAMASGLEAADHAINLLIELEVTRGKNDAVEEIIDSGLETARAVVQTVRGDISGADLAVENAVAFRAAVDSLRERLEAEGKTWLTSRHTLNLLIEAAVSSFKN